MVCRRKMRGHTATLMRGESQRRPWGERKLSCLPGAGQRFAESPTRASKPYPHLHYAAHDWKALSGGLGDAIPKTIAERIATRYPSHKKLNCPTNSPCNVPDLRHDCSLPDTQMRKEKRTIQYSPELQLSQLGVYRSRRRGRSRIAHLPPQASGSV